MKTLIQQFVEKHNNWEELLTTDPYNLKIRRDSINDIPYIMFSYNQINSDFMIPLVREARGIIFREDTMELRCFAFKKFGNYGENYVDKIDWTSARVEEKIDGSILKLWFEPEISKKLHRDFWTISTNNTINAYACDLPLPDGKIKTFGHLFTELWQQERLASEDHFPFNKKYCYFFEICSLQNKIVVPFEIPQLYHIGTRNLDTLEEISVDIGIQKPKVYNLKTLEACIEAAGKLPFSKEGYVMVDKDYNRIKIKGLAYLKLHRLKGNGVITNKRILDIVRLNEESEFLTYFSEYTEQFNSVKVQYNNFLALLEKNVDEYKKFHQDEDRKILALWVINNCILPALIFNLKDGKIKNIEEYVESLTTNKLLFYMEKTIDM